MKVSHWAAREVIIASSAAKALINSDLKMLFDIGCIHSHTESLDLTGCDKINDLTVLNHLSALKVLRLDGCAQITSAMMATNLLALS